MFVVMNLTPEYKYIIMVFIGIVPKLLETLAIFLNFYRV